MKKYEEVLAEIDSWMHDKMANGRVRIVIEGELGEPMGVVAMFYDLEHAPRSPDLYLASDADGYGATPLEALGELIRVVEEEK